MNEPAPKPSSAPNLFSPLQLGHLLLRNRIVLPPHATLYAADGLVTDRQVAYYEARARGEAAMIVAGNWSAWPRSHVSPTSNSAWNPAALEGHRRLADAVHRHGAHLVAQLHDGGRQSTSSWHRLPLLAPSAIPDPLVREIPKELEKHEIEEMLESFVRSAQAIQAAGWDGAEFLAAQGYGLSQFLSPQTNWRDDEYGGDTLGRSTLLLRLVSQVRNAVGHGFLLGVRMNGSDMVEGGATVEDAKVVASALEATGVVDYLSISGASNENYPLWIADMSHQRGQFVDAAAEIRKITSLPLIVTTRIKDPTYADQIIASGVVDMVGMVRALIADPEMPRKARQGKVDEIRPCISCNQGCVSQVQLGSDMRCTVNPRAGHEYVAALPTPARRRRILVVGAGPAGLHLADAAASVGHRVRVVEQRQNVGGQLAMAARVTSRGEFSLIVDYLARHAAAAGAVIDTGVEATLALVRDEAPDLLVLATGSRPVRTGYSSFRPAVREVPGASLPHVRTSWDTFDDPAGIGQRVLIADDDMHGQSATVAEFLAELGRDVTIVCRALSVSPWAVATQGFLYRRLLTAGVRILPLTWVDHIEPHTVRCSNIYSGETVDVGSVDTVILATGNAAHDGLYRDVTQHLPETTTVRIGDCLAPRRLDQAIWDAEKLAQTLGC